LFEDLKIKVFDLICEFLLQVDIQHLIKYEKYETNVTKNSDSVKRVQKCCKNDAMSVENTVGMESN